jgi:glycosyltransferase involved in cell wall biosynthesis
MDHGDLDRPADVIQLVKPKLISHFMHLIWNSRPDLQQAFDLSREVGQQGFVGWFEGACLREYGIPPIVPQENTETPSPPPPGYFKAKAAMRARRHWVSWLPVGIRRFFRKTFLLAVGVVGEAEKGLEQKGASPGANLIGYAHGALGMGEHVRMTAEALSGYKIQHGVYDFAIGVENRQERSVSNIPYINDNRYSINIFHVNADQMLTAYCHLGPSFFTERYNIGFWAWELSKCPENWFPVLHMVDEIWAPSRFIERCFQEVTQKPVRYMPLCVELPEFEGRSRDSFGLSDDNFIFIYMFDFLSYIDRKNPFAAIEAFKRAFPDRSAPVTLVLKVMNGDTKNDKWLEMEQHIAGDKRIVVMNQVMSRLEVLALVDCCDCFVSLHRSEGFGRGPAEAMYLGKPVIVTDYSGNTDFTLKDNSFLVDYRLVPVEEGQYVFGDGQVWADPSVETAARHMRFVIENPRESAAIAKAGQAYIKENFSAGVTGKIMQDRLAELCSV